nr:zinc-binding dehydrogenase [Saccharopolyspora spinosa]
MLRCDRPQGRCHHATRPGPHAITGASGGVGSAVVQLANRRGATVITLSSSSAKADERRTLRGADHVVDRSAELVAALGEASNDVVVDLVCVGGGRAMARLPRHPAPRRALREAGANRRADRADRLRTRYLKDLTLLDCTFQEDEVFGNLVSHVEAGEIRACVAKVFPPKAIGRALEEFLSKTFTGKLVLTIPEVGQ